MFVSYPFVNKNTVNKFMDVFVASVRNGGYLRTSATNPFHVRAALGCVVTFPCGTVPQSPGQRLFFFVIAGSQKSKLLSESFSLKRLFLIELADKIFSSLIRSAPCQALSVACVSVFFVYCLCAALVGVSIKLLFMLFHIGQYPL